MGAVRSFSIVLTVAIFCIGDSSAVIGQVYPSRPDHAWSCRSPPAGRRIPWRASWPSACGCRSVNPSSSRTSTGAAGSIGVGRVARAAPDGYTLSIGNWSTHVVNGAVYALQYDRAEGFRAGRAAREQSAADRRKEGHAGEGPEGIDRLAEGQPGQGVAGDRRRRQRIACRRRLLPEETGTRFRFVPYRGAAPAMQDLVAGQIDLMIDMAANAAAAGPCRQHQGLCRHGQDPARGSARHSDRRRGGIAGLLHLALVRALGAQGHAEGRHRQAQCRGRGCFGRSRRCGARLADLGQEILAARAADAGGARARFRRPRSRSGGRSSRRRTSRRSDRSRGERCVDLLKSLVFAITPM